MEYFAMDGIAFFLLHMGVWKLVTAMKSKSGIKFSSFQRGPMGDTTLVVDCSHPSCLQITHHLKGPKQKVLNDASSRGDASTDGVFNSWRNGYLCTKNFEYVTTNHFDIDSFLSVFTVINPSISFKYERYIRECANIGDFRHLNLDEEWKFDALRLACWLNSQEKRLFYRPFGSLKMDLSEDDEMKNEKDKFSYFLQVFEHVLTSLLSKKYESTFPITTAVSSYTTPKTSMITYQEIIDQSEEEYQRVLYGYNLLHKDSLSSRSIASKSTSYYNKYSECGLVVIHTPEPLHYYSLFSCSLGDYDIILSVYNNNRYELETKYTGYVDLMSRPCLPRVEMHPLVVHLNKLEKTFYSNEDEYKDREYEWICDSIHDSGPLLRLDKILATDRLTKAERYGHPYERPIFPSHIPSDIFVDTVLSYLRLVYTNVIPKRDWEWKELIEFNKNLVDKIEIWSQTQLQS